MCILSTYLCGVITDDDYKYAVLLNKYLLEKNGKWRLSVSYSSSPHFHVLNNFMHDYPTRTDIKTRVNKEMNERTNLPISLSLYVCRYFFTDIQTF